MSNALASTTARLFKGWRELLRDYDERHRPKRDDELEWFASQETFAQLLKYVARAQRNGKRLDHQRRIRREAIREAECALAANSAALRSARSFRELHAAVHEAVGDIRGIGPLYCYDAALRIGAFLRIDPEGVYLHAGTKNGARAFVDVRNKGCLAVAELPAELRSRSPAEIENILCIYKSSFAAGSYRSNAKRHC